MPFTAYPNKDVDYVLYCVLVPGVGILNLEALEQRKTKFHKSRAGSGRSKFGGHNVIPSIIMLCTASHTLLGLVI